MDNRTDAQINLDLQAIVDETIIIRPQASMSEYRRMAHQAPMLLVDRIRTLEIDVKLYQERNARLAKMNANLSADVLEILGANRDLTHKLETLDAWKVAAAKNLEGWLDCQESKRKA